MGVKVNAIIAGLGIPTTDKRTLLSGDFRNRVGIHLLEDKKGRVPYSDNRIIGWFEAKSITNQMVFGEGELDQWPDENCNFMGVGIDLDTLDFDGIVHMGEEFTINRGRLCGVTVYHSNSGYVPAWPFARMWPVN